MAGRRGRSRRSRRTGTISCPCGDYLGSTYLSGAQRKERTFFFGLKIRIVSKITACVSHDLRFFSLLSRASACNRSSLPTVKVLVAHDGGVPSHVVVRRVGRNAGIKRDRPDPVLEKPKQGVNKQRQVPRMGSCVAAPVRKTGRESERGQRFCCTSTRFFSWRTGRAVVVPRNPTWNTH